jgi:hypothetical protein
MNRRLYKQQWSVPSETNGDVTYKVSEKVNGDFVCSCPHNIFRKELCKHIINVFEYEALRDRFISMRDRLYSFNILKIN